MSKYKRTLGFDKPWSEVKVETDAREREDAGGEKHCGERAWFEAEGLWECNVCGAYKFHAQSWKKRS